MEFPEDDPTMVPGRYLRLFGALFYPVYKTERRNRPWLVPISKNRLPVQMLEEENPPL